MLTALCFLQFGFNNGQTMVDGFYAGNRSQVLTSVSVSSLWSIDPLSKMCEVSPEL